MVTWLLRFPMKAETSLHNWHLYNSIRCGSGSLGRNDPNQSSSICYATHRARFHFKLAFYFHVVTHAHTRTHLVIFIHIVYNDTERPLYRYEIHNRWSFIVMQSTLQMLGRKALASNLIHSMKSFSSVPPTPPL